MKPNRWNMKQHRSFRVLQTNAFNRIPLAGIIAAEALCSIKHSSTTVMIHVTKEFICIHTRYITFLPRFCLQKFFKVWSSFEEDVSLLQLQECVQFVPNCLASYGLLELHSLLTYTGRHIMYFNTSEPHSTYGSIWKYFAVYRYALHYTFAHIMRVIWSKYLPLSKIGLLNLAFT